MRIAPANAFLRIEIFMMMLKELRTAICLIGLLVFSEKSFSQLNVIPKPSEVTVLTGVDSFVLTPQTLLVVEQPALQSSADFLNTYLKEVYGFVLKTTKKGSSSKSIVLSASKINSTVPGAYEMATGKDVIVIKGGESGVFYGMQTLLQLLSIQKTQSLSIPAVQIKDAPRYQYRGMHLDVSRHFFNVDFVKRYIDYIAFHKMNTFHWHLTDDQGW